MTQAAMSMMMWQPTDANTLTVLAVGSETMKLVAAFTPGPALTFEKLGDAMVATSPLYTLR